MLKMFQKNIVAQIILLLTLFIVSFAGLRVGQGLLNERQSYLQMLLENEQVKMELSHILQKKILAMNVKLRDMSTTTSIAELRRTSTFLSVLQAELMKILVVLDLGGIQSVNNLVNFGFDEAMSRNLEYRKFGKQTINIEILELKAKLIELEDIVKEFQPIVEQKIYILEGRDLIQIAGAIRRVDNYYKGIEPFFKRMLGNSHFLHSQSLQEMERIRKINAQFSHTYQQVDSISMAVTLAFILLMGALVLKSSRRILLERQHFQQQLLETNENLEAIIHKRTSALKAQVADRKVAEIKIKEQADFLRKVIESLNYPFYVIDAQDYSIVLANTVAFKQGDGTQTTCYALTHNRDIPCDNVEIPCPLQMMQKTGKSVVLERTRRNKKGEKIFSEVHGYPIFDDSGNLTQMIEYSLDITDKKRAEFALKLANDQLEQKVKERTSALEEQILERKKIQLQLIKSERYYRRIIENISDIITIVDSDGVISYVSPSLPRVMGIPAERVIGRNIRELVDPADMSGIDIQTLYEEFCKKNSIEYRAQTRSGHVLIMESYIFKFEQDDGSDGYIFSSRDITARKQAEEETHKLKKVVEQSPSSVVITDTKGTIEYVNPAFEKITGYTLAEAVGRNPRILKSGDTPESAFSQLWTTITAGRIWRGEFINKKKNGEFYDENVLVIPIKNSKGEITNFVAVKENITEIKKARKQAEDANQAKSNFLSQMSHELRTPLNAINGFSQLMLKSKKNPLNEKQKGMTEQIHTAGRHLLELINEVLDIAKIESGQFSLSIKVFNPQIAITDCISLTRPLAQEKQIKITDHCEGKELPFLRADTTRVKQILLNLLSNAVKYNNPSGTVNIDVKMDIPGFLQFVVKDDGIGIPLEKQEGIFTPFVRAVENPDDIEGTGIGMTITKQLVEQMGGDIGFESQVGEGSSFWFTLPISVRDSLLDKPIVSIEKQELEPAAVT